MRNSDGLTGFNVAVHGTVVSSENTAILLDSNHNSTGRANHRVSIGQTGIVRSLTAMGVVIDGHDSSVFYDGAIFAKSRGIYDLSGDRFDVVNTGLISAGEGIVSSDAVAIRSSEAPTLISRGTIAGGTDGSGASVAINLNARADLIRNVAQ